MDTFDVLYLRHMLAMRRRNMLELASLMAYLMPAGDKPTHFPEGTPVSIQLAVRSFEGDITRNVIEVIDRHLVDIDAAIKEAGLL